MIITTYKELLGTCIKSEKTAVTLQHIKEEMSFLAYTVSPFSHANVQELV